MVRPPLIDLNPVELKYYPFGISLDKCTGSCNVLSEKVCVPKETKDINVTAFNMITNKNGAKKMAKHISSLSDCNGTKIPNHLVCKQTLNHLAKLVKWLNCVVSTYLYNTFDCMFLSCHVRVSEWIHTLLSLLVKAAISEV